jgi:hypothetical protein
VIPQILCIVYCKQPHLNRKLTWPMYCSVQHHCSCNFRHSSNTVRTQFEHSSNHSLCNSCLMMCPNSCLVNCLAMQQICFELVCLKHTIISTVVFHIHATRFCFLLKGMFCMNCFCCSQGVGGYHSSLIH